MRNFIDPTNPYDNIRWLLRLTRHELAERLKISYVYLIKLERGERAMSDPIRKQLIHLIDKVIDETPAPTSRRERKLYDAIVLYLDYTAIRLEKREI